MVFINNVFKESKNNNNDKPDIFIVNDKIFSLNSEPL